MQKKSDRGPVAGLVTVCLAVTMLPVSLTGSSVAVPAVAAEFHNSLASGEWIVNGYGLTFAAFVLTTGSLADLFGRRRLFALGSGVFAVCSLASALSDDITTLDIARLAAGAGAAAMLTSGSAILAGIFEGAALARAFSVFGTCVGTGLALGPFIAGTLQETLGWRAIFLVPAIAGALVLGFSSLLPELPGSSVRGRGAVDWPGMVSFTGALAAVISALLEGPEVGWWSPLNLAAYVLGALLLAAFFLAERKARHPLFDLRLLRQPMYASLCVAIVALVFGFTPLLVYLPSYFASVRDESTFHSGVALLMLTLPTLVLPAVTAYGLRWIPLRHLVTLAVALTAIGSGWLVVITPEAGNWTLLGPFLVIGTGFGVSIGVMDGAAVASVEPSRAGVAAGMFNTMRLAGEAVGIAVVGSLLASLTQFHLTEGLARDPALYSAAPPSLAAQLDQGQLATALGAVPQGAREALAGVAQASYTEALHDVLWILAGFCFATALGLIAPLCIPAAPTKPAKWDTYSSVPIQGQEK